MKKFSIDLIASDKGERKKAVKYLKSKGLVFGDADRFKDSKHWAYISIADGEFIYITQLTSNPIILTLPRDWDKLVEIVEEDSKAMKDSCERILSKSQENMVSDLFGNLPSMPICPLPFFDCRGITHRPDSEEQQIKNLKAEAKLQIKIFKAEKDLLKAELQETINKL